MVGTGACQTLYNDFVRSSQINCNLHYSRYMESTMTFTQKCLTCLLLVYSLRSFAKCIRPTPEKPYYVQEISPFHSNQWRCLVAYIKKTQSNAGLIIIIAKLRLYLERFRIDWTRQHQIALQLSY